MPLDDGYLQYERGDSMIDFGTSVMPVGSVQPVPKEYELDLSSGSTFEDISPAANGFAVAADPTGSMVVLRSLLTDGLDTPNAIHASSLVFDDSGRQSRPYGAPLANPASPSRSHASFTPDGTRFVVAGGRDLVPVFATAPDSATSYFAWMRSLTCPDAGAISPDGQFVVTVQAGRQERPVMTADLGHSTELRLPLCWSSADALVAFGSSSRVTAVLTDNVITFRNVSQGQPVGPRLPVCAKSDESDACKVTALAFGGTLRDGTVAVSSNAVTRTWRLHDGHAVRLGDRLGTAVALSENGDIATRRVGNDAIVSTISDDNRHARCTFPAGATYAIAPNGRMAATLDGTELKEYDLAHSCALLGVPQPTSESMVRFSRDSRSLFTAGETTTDSGSRDLTVRSARDGSIRVQVPMPADAVFGDTPFNPSSIVQRHDHLIVLAGSVVIDLPLSVTELEQAACRRSSRNLTREEWSR